MKGPINPPSILFLLAISPFLHFALAQCGCCDGGCCGGCCECGCGCGPTIQIQLPQRNQSSQGACPPGLNIPQQGGGGGGQQNASSSTAMNDQIPKMVAELIAQDLIGKMNGANGGGGQKSEEGAQEEEKPKKSRPKAKTKGGRKDERRRKRRQAVWPLGPNHSHLHQPAQQLSEQELEQKFQQVLFLQQRPLTPLQAEPPPLQPPEFPVPIQPDADSPSNPPKPTKMGPLRVIHVKPTSLGKFTLVEGQFEIGDEDLKHPFEEPFQ